MDVTARFKRAVRIALGLRVDSDLPQLDRMLFYRAEVKAMAADGSTVDLQPEDDRIEPHQGVPLRTCLPGCTVVVKADTVVALGWEEGDPQRYYAAPIFESSGGITKVVVKADMVYLGDEAGAEALVKKSEFEDHTHPVPGGGTTCVNGNAWTGTATSSKPAAITGTTNVKGK